VPYAVGIVSSTIWIVKALLILKLAVASWAYWLTPAHDGLQAWVDWLSSTNWADGTVPNGKLFSSALDEGGSFWRLSAHPNSFVLVCGGSLLLIAWIVIEVLRGTVSRAMGVRFRIAICNGKKAWDRFAGSRQPLPFFHEIIGGNNSFHDGMRLMRPAPPMCSCFCVMTCGLDDMIMKLVRRIMRKDTRSQQIKVVGARLGDEPPFDWIHLEWPSKLPVCCACTARSDALDPFCCASSAFFCDILEPISLIRLPMRLLLLLMGIHSRRLRVTRKLFECLSFKQLKIQGAENVTCTQMGPHTRWPAFSVNACAHTLAIDVCTPDAPHYAPRYRDAFKYDRSLTVRKHGSSWETLRQYGNGDVKWQPLKLTRKGSLYRVYAVMGPKAVKKFGRLIKQTLEPFEGGMGAEDAGNMSCLQAVDELSKVTQEMMLLAYDLAYEAGVRAIKEKVRNHSPDVQWHPADVLVSNPAFGLRGMHSSRSRSKSISSRSRLTTWNRWYAAFCAHWWGSSRLRDVCRPSALFRTA
jgi:hypothetical protein